MDSFFSKKFIISTCAIAFLYIALFAYSLNFSFLLDTLLGGYDVLYKAGVFIVLFEGLWEGLDGRALGILVLVALLTGANTTLLIDRMKLLKQLGGLHLVVGGSSLLGIVASGCASCGLSLISLLGFGGSLLYLPYHGGELAYISVFFLAISLVMLIKNANESCQMNHKNGKK